MSRQDYNPRISKGGNRPRAGFYTSHIEALPSNLEEEYRRFNASLSPAQRKQLNLHSPKENPTGEIRPIYKDSVCIPVETDRPDNYGPSNLLSEALVHNDPQPQDPSSNPQPTKLDLVVVLEVIRRLLAIYEVSPDLKTRLHGEIIALALGVPGAGNVSDLARKYGCSRQVISKRMTRVITALDLPPTWRMVQAQKAAQLKTLDELTRIRRKGTSPSG